MDDLLEDYKKDHPFVEDYCYNSYTLKVIFDNYANIYNPKAELSFEWYLSTIN